MSTGTCRRIERAAATGRRVIRRRFRPVLPGMMATFIGNRRMVSSRLFVDASQIGDCRASRHCVHPHGLARHHGHGQQQQFEISHRYKLFLFSFSSFFY